MKIKICGIKDLSMALWSVEAGATAIGINFYPSSPRFLSLQEAEKVCLPLKERHPDITLAAVTVSPTPEEAKQIMEELPFDYLQIHGPCPWLSKSPFPVIRALNPANEEELRTTVDEAEDAVKIFLIEGKSKKITKQFGGTGEGWPYEWVKNLNSKQPCWIAGGLTPENIASIVQEIKPDGIDTASGVESLPGVKDRKKIKNFCSLARKGFQQSTKK